MSMLRGSKLSRTTYRASDLTGGPVSTKNSQAADLRDKRGASGETFAASARSARPKYPPPPRSGNAFAAAVLVAIPGFLLLTALLWVLNSIRNVLGM
jgi:hypothetical protein